MGLIYKDQHRISAVGVEITKEKKPPPQGPPYSPLNFFRGRGGLEKYLVYKNELGGLSNKILYLNTNQKYCLYQTKMRINDK